MPNQQKKLYRLGLGGAEMWGAGGPTTGLKGLIGAQKSGEGLWDVPEYPQPTAGWWSGLDQNVRSGIMEPYMDMANQMGEQFGAAGMGGSPLTGSTGAFGAALGDQMGQWGGQAALTGWNMLQPGYQNEFNAQLQSNMAPWTMAPSYLGALAGYMPQAHVTQKSNPFSEMLGLGMAGTSLFGNPFKSMFPKAF